MLHMIYRYNMCYSLLVEGLFCYNADFVIMLFSLGSHHQHYNKVAVYMEFCNSVNCVKTKCAFVTKGVHDHCVYVCMHYVSIHVSIYV